MLFFLNSKKASFWLFSKKAQNEVFCEIWLQFLKKYLKKTGLWGFWDFQVGFLATILKNQNFSIFLKNAISLEKNFFKKIKQIFCNFITRGKKLIKNFLSRKFNESKKLKLKNYVFYGNFHFILVYENVFGYKN